ncbi:MAG: hypothetical protein KAI43_02715 [Candidatus Aureabacteria bacterium]|nr:hypothetical protein [Candidatus Auribacterota bacterium]
MTNHNEDISQCKAARVAGFIFLLSLINGVLMNSKFIVLDNVIATANNIMAKEFLFCIDIPIRSDFCLKVGQT